MAVGAESGGIEEVIVTSTGNCAVRWKLRNVQVDYSKGRFLYNTPGQSKCDRHADIHKLDALSKAHAFGHGNKTETTAFALEDRMEELTINDFK